MFIIIKDPLDEMVTSRKVDERCGKIIIMIILCVNVGQTKLLFTGFAEVVSVVVVVSVV